jgi:hypothetical protein
MDTPVLDSLSTISAAVRDACWPLIRATAPETWGDAWDVPAMVMFAALIRAPGASMVRNEALLEKQATLSAVVVRSLHTDQYLLPTFAS